MSKEFWHAVGLVLLICALAVPIIGWSFTDDHSFLVGFSMLSIMGAGFMLQLGNASDSRKDRKK